ncbi:MAG: hypothetical protein WCD72_05090 [Dehalococcoidia bacterium]
MLKRLIDIQAADIEPYITKGVSIDLICFYQIRDKVAQIISLSFSTTLK